VFNAPELGPLTVAGSRVLQTVHLVTRAAGPEQRSLVYVNGTEVTGRLRNPLDMPNTIPFGKCVASRACRAVPTPPVLGLSLLACAEEDPLAWVEPRASDDMSLSLLGEFSITKPAYLHIATMRSGGLPLLWVTQFSMTRKGSVTGLDLFAASPRVTQLGYSFSWPNEVRHLAAGTVKEAADDALLVADGFLMPGRSDGGIYIVQEPGTPLEKVRAARGPLDLLESAHVRRCGGAGDSVDEAASRVVLSQGGVGGRARNGPAVHPNRQGNEAFLRQDRGQCSHARGE
jgi:hypothetical protein